MLLLSSSAVCPFLLATSQSPLWPVRSFHWVSSDLPCSLPTCPPDSATFETSFLIVFMLWQQVSLPLFDLRKLSLPLLLLAFHETSSMFLMSSILSQLLCDLLLRISSVLRLSASPSTSIVQSSSGLFRQSGRVSFVVTPLGARSKCWGRDRWHSTHPMNPCSLDWRWAMASAASSLSERKKTLFDPFGGRPEEGSVYTSSCTTHHGPAKCLWP